MYATIDPFRPQPDGGAATAGLPRNGAQPLGTIALAHVDDESGTLLAFWPDETAAGAAGSRVFRVDEMHGRAAGRRPLFAQVTWMNGDGDPARADAAERGGRDRIWPAVRDVEGIVEVFALRSADDRVAVVALTTDTETFEEVQRRVLGTTLLPDEDPALLPGADRIDTARVLLAELPSEVRS